MTIAAVLSYKVQPTELGYEYLKRIRYAVPYEALFREGLCPIGAYLIPFVDRLGGAFAWVPFAEEPVKGMVYVRIPYPADPSRIYRVGENGELETVTREVNEDN